MFFKRAVFIKIGNLSTGGALIFLRFYQRFLSFDTGLLKLLVSVDRTCRFTPSCSEYAYQAIKKYGILWGVYLGLRRIIRCHPFSKEHFDPVP